METRLVKRFTPFATITGDAARHNIGPVSLAAQGPWNDMVIGQFVQWGLLPAILAGITITRVDMLPREFDAPRAYANQLEERTTAGRRMVRLTPESREYTPP